ncbi:STAS domain-containing protein [Actinoplanes awajinensis]|uniref:STAS domain-containing protein n=1 Tax=Actinoplanes awajinensis subsp. mycoplanecinus TaxID=135947 RepID=A0A101JJ15_9ACTN|nr:STAS domain-containing protein [Actinoplanes awajinensis]KUL27677.1 hypothetical protein ADL15_34570 [Actinoplanes awajinensis subsp. mycoplanecinus]
MAMLVTWSMPGQIQVSGPVRGTVTVTLAGSFDLANAPQIATTLRRVLTGPAPARLVLDAAEVDFCDCSVLRELLLARAEGESLGCPVVLAQASPVLVWLLDLFDLGRLFGYPSTVPGAGSTGESSG